MPPDRQWGGGDSAGWDERDDDLRAQALLSAARHQNLSRHAIAATRRFAEVEGHTAAVLRHAADTTGDPETAARRRRLADLAEVERSRALDRADRLVEAAARGQS